MADVRRRRRDEPGMGFRELIGYQSEGPLRPLGKGGPSTGQGGGPPSTHSPQAIAYLARTVGGNEGGNGEKIAALIDGLVSDGVWAKLDCLYVLAQQNVTDARLNLIGATSNLPTTAATFTALRGFSAFPARIDTGFNLRTVGAKWVRGSGNFGIWAMDNVVSLEAQAASSQSSEGIYLSVVSDGSIYANIYGTTGIYTQNTHLKGLFAVERASLTGSDVFWNGISIAPTPDDAAIDDDVDFPAPKSETFKIGGTVGDLTTTTLSSAHIGAALGPTLNLALYNRLNTYMTAVTPVVSSVWSAADAAANAMTLSNGGLTVATATGVWGTVRTSPTSKTTGKLYIELSVGGGIITAGLVVFGFASTGFVSTSYLGSTNYSAGIWPTTGNYVSGFTSNYVSSFPHAAANDVWGLAIDFAAGSIWVSRNNVWSDSSNPATASLPIISFTPATVGALFAAVSVFDANSGTWTLRPTAASQTYAPPSGFSPWDTATGAGLGTSFALGVSPIG